MPPFISANNYSIWITEKNLYIIGTLTCVTSRYVMANAPPLPLLVNGFCRLEADIELPVSPICLLIFGPDRKVQNEDDICKLLR
jgi:hypothetical protein